MIFFVQVFTILFSFQVDQNLDFMCEVEDGWWKGRLGGRVSWTILAKFDIFAFFGLSFAIILYFRLVFSPPTLSRCVKMTQLIQSNPVQKQLRNYHYRQRFENFHWKRCFICALFRRLTSCLHHWRRDLLLQSWRQKTRRIHWGQIGEQLFAFLHIV